MKRPSAKAGKKRPALRLVGGRNWRGEPARKCYACGSTRTIVGVDPETRVCERCGAEYAVEPEREAAARYGNLGSTNLEGFQKLEAERNAYIEAERAKLGTKDAPSLESEMMKSTKKAAAKKPAKPTAPAKPSKPVPSKPARKAPEKAAKKPAPRKSK